LRSRRDDNLSARSVVFHRTVRLNDLIDEKGLSNRRFESSCLNCIDHLLQWRRNEILGSRPL
jgi:hypothetical protein